MVKTSPTLNFFSFTACYFILEKLAIHVDSTSGLTPTIWIPTGVALACLFILGLDLWVGVALASFAAHLTSSMSPLMSLVIAIGNTGQAYMGAAFLRKKNFRPSLDSLRDILLLVSFCSLIVTAFSATFVTLVREISRQPPPQGMTLFEYWYSYWASDALSNAIVAPFIFFWFSEKMRFDSKKVFEVCLLSVSLLSAVALVFGPSFQPISATAHATSYIFYPLVVWSAVRFGQAGNVTMVLAISLFSATGTALGWGPFSHGNLRASCPYLCVYLWIVATTGLTLAASVSERKKAIIERRQGELALHRSHEFLKRMFEERTTELQKSEERFRLMVEGIKEYSIFMLDAEGRIATWNMGAKNLFGYEAREVIGRHFYKSWRSEDVERGIAVIALETSRTLGRYEWEGYRVRKDGSQFWAHSIMSAIRGKNGEVIGFYKITRDLTEIKNAEDQVLQAHAALERRVEERTLELQEANENLLRTEVQLKSAIRSRDEFLSIASHELKTPITSLSLQIQLAQRNLRPESERNLEDERLTKIFELSNKQVNRLTHLIDDLLDASRIQTGKLTFNFERANLSSIAKDMLERFTPQLSKANIEVFSNIANSVFVKGDLTRLEQIMDNLISNVIKYAPGKPMLVTLKGVEGSARLVVSDLGPGIPTDFQNKLFERYERGGAGSNVGGLGLGLYIVKEIVLGHGGSVKIHSGPRAGTKVIVEIPSLVVVAEESGHKSAGGFV